jgi:hypothetical protein
MRDNKMNYNNNDFMIIQARKGKPSQSSSTGNGDTDDDDDGDGPLQLKKVHYCHREYDEITLNPRWCDDKNGGTFHIPLPCPKKVILSAVNTMRSSATVAISDLSTDIHVSTDYINGNSRVKKFEDEEIDRNNYNKACKALLDYWGQGCIKIHVVDGERFNEDIFLGEVTLLLSTFLVPQMVKKSTQNSPLGVIQPQHFISGNYPLNKVKASDRVSGSLAVQASLHLPLASFIDVILHPTSPQSAQSKKTSSPAPIKIAWTEGGNEAVRNPSPGFLSLPNPPPLALPLHPSLLTCGSEDHSFNVNGIASQSVDSESLPLVNEWDDDEEGGVLELSFAPHSPKVTESPDRKLFRVRPAVSSFLLHGHHGQGMHIKAKHIRRGSIDEITNSVADSVSLAHSELLGGSKRLQLDFLGEESCGWGNGDLQENPIIKSAEFKAPSSSFQCSSSKSGNKGSLALIRKKKGLESRKIGRDRNSMNGMLNPNRRSMLEDVSKCLNGLSIVQEDTDGLLERMNRQLEKRQSAKAGDQSPSKKIKEELVEVSHENVIAEEFSEITREEITAKYSEFFYSENESTLFESEDESGISIEEDKIQNKDMIEGVRADRDDMCVNAKGGDIGEDGREEKVQENSMYQVFKAVKRSQQLLDIDLENDDEDSEMIVIASSDFTITRSSTNGAESPSSSSILSCIVSPVEIGNKSISTMSFQEIETSPIASLSPPSSQSLSPASSPSLLPPTILPSPQIEIDIDINSNGCDSLMDFGVMEGEFADVSTLHTEIDLIPATATIESSSSFSFIPIEVPEENVATEIEEI